MVPSKFLKTENNGELKPPQNLKIDLVWLNMFRSELSVWLRNDCG